MSISFSNLLSERKKSRENVDVREAQKRDDEKAITGQNSSETASPQILQETKSNSEENKSPIGFFSRKRSSSENDFKSSSEPRKLFSSLEERAARYLRPTDESPRTSSMVMSLSNLLPDRMRTGENADRPDGASSQEKESDTKSVSTTRKFLSSLEERASRYWKHSEEPQKTSTMAMSFSHLAAEGAESKEEADDDIFDIFEEEKEQEKSVTKEITKSHPQTMEDEKPKQSPKHQPLSSPFKNFQKMKPQEKEKPAHVSLVYLYVLSLSVYCYFVLPVPDPIHNLVCSFLLGFLSATILLCLVASPKKQLPVLPRPYINQSVPDRIPKNVYDLSQSFKGWMNEIELYDVNTYHINSTQSVFVTLEGSTMRLQTPLRNIARRSLYGEGNIPVSNVTHQRIYNITGAKVYLLPPGLTKKRTWSKKYPICIEINTDEGSSVDDVIYANDENGNVTVEKIYLFGRTCRQKEEWFYRLQRAVSMTKSDYVKVSEFLSLEERNIPSALGDVPPTSDDKPGEEGSDGNSWIILHENFDFVASYRDYYVSMCRVMPDPAVYKIVHSGSSAQELSKGNPKNDEAKSVHFSAAASQTNKTPGVIFSQPRSMLHSTLPGEPGLEVAWFNVFLGRMMFDFLRRPKWVDWLSTKIQRKLEKIQLPYFIEGLKLTGLDPGKTIPLVHKISLPRLDSQGIWLDMEITYSGALQLTLETKMVLTKLGKELALKQTKKKLENVTDIPSSDDEDSAESSEEDESTVSRYVSNAVSATRNILMSSSGDSPKAKDRLSGTTAQTPGSATPGQHREKRWVRIVDRISKSKYFQRAAENKYIKKKLETVSNTPVVLTAELHQCQGTLCLNIPPPPSDRIWYGFKEPPHMVLKARPKLGQREITVTPITDWIEKKLLQEINKVLLMPNMDDIPVPLMFNNLPTS